MWSINVIYLPYPPTPVAYTHDEERNSDVQNTIAI